MGRRGNRKKLLAVQSQQNISYHAQAGCHQSAALGDMAMPHSYWFSASNMEFPCLCFSRLPLIIILADG